MLSSFYPEKDKYRARSTITMAATIRKSIILFTFQEISIWFTVQKHYSTFWIISNAVSLICFSSIRAIIAPLSSFKNLSKINFQILKDRTLHRPRTTVNIRLAIFRIFKLIDIDDFIDWLNNPVLPNPVFFVKG